MLPAPQGCELGVGGGGCLRSRTPPLPLSVGACPGGTHRETPIRFTGRPL